MTLATVRSVNIYISERSSTKWKISARIVSTILTSIFTLYTISSAVETEGHVRDTLQQETPAGDRRTREVPKSSAGGPRILEFELRTQGYRGACNVSSYRESSHDGVGGNTM